MNCPPLVWESTRTARLTGHCPGWPIVSGHCHSDSGEESRARSGQGCLHSTVTGWAETRELKIHISLNGHKAWADLFMRLAWLSSASTGLETTWGRIRTIPSPNQCAFCQNEMGWILVPKMWRLLLYSLDDMKSKYLKTSWKHEKEEWKLLISDSLLSVKSIHIPQYICQ